MTANKTSDEKTNGIKIREPPDADRWVKDHGKKRRGEGWDEPFPSMERSLAISNRLGGTARQKTRASSTLCIVSDSGGGRKVRGIGGEKRLSRNEAL